VAIDLRQNRGGDGTLIVPFIRSIIPSERIDRPGHLFAIIAPATFSAAQMLTDALEKYTNIIIFVGEPSGSKGNTYGESRKIVLPNSGITVRVAIYYWQDWHPLDKRDATVPQISAPLTFEAYRHKTDPALEAIIAYGDGSGHFAGGLPLSSGARSAGVAEILPCARPQWFGDLSCVHFWGLNRPRCLRYSQSRNYVDSWAKFLYLNPL
jgi:hypothetical protein